MAEKPINQLAQIEEFESRVFRAGQVARRLIADHIDLPLYGVRLTTAVNQIRVRLEANRDQIRPWAAAYGAELTTMATDDGDAVFVHLSGETEIDGCPVDFSECRMLTGARAEAWRAEQADRCETCGKTAAPSMALCDDCGADASATMTAAAAGGDGS